MKSILAKFFTSITMIILATVLASVFGIIHNQISYTIGPSYFTDFKFEQFHFQDYAYNNERFYAGLIGFLATWWFGLMIGIVLSITGSICFNLSIIKKQLLRAIKNVFIITTCFSLLGIIIGGLSFLFTSNPLIPESLKRFSWAGTMHNLSYLGGVIGLIYAMVMMIKAKITN